MPRNYPFVYEKCFQAQNKMSDSRWILSVSHGQFLDSLGNSIIKGRGVLVGNFEKIT